MAVKKGAAYIGRNRAPRVQIEYKVEEYGSERVVQLPFIVGVMADLAGKSESEEAQKPAEQRTMREVNARTFNDYMNKLRPRVAFTVDNKLTDGDPLLVDITFESLDDFAPGKVAEKVEALQPYIQARKRLRRLLSLVDGRPGAEKLVGEALNSEALLTSLAEEAKAAPSAAGDAAETKKPAGGDD